MNINPGTAVPFGPKHLGDLSKHTPAVNELLTAILKVVEMVGAQCLSVYREETKRKLFFFPRFY